MNMFLNDLGNDLRLTYKSTQSTDVMAHLRATN